MFNTMSIRFLVLSPSINHFHIWYSNYHDYFKSLPNFTVNYLLDPHTQLVGFKSPDRLLLLPDYQSNPRYTSELYDSLLSRGYDITHNSRYSYFFHAYVVTQYPSSSN